jgi:hypothetical protein
MKTVRAIEVTKLWESEVFFAGLELLIR